MTLIRLNARHPAARSVLRTYTSSKMSSAEGRRESERNYSRPRVIIRPTCSSKLLSSLRESSPTYRRALLLKAFSVEIARSRRGKCHTSRGVQRCIYDTVIDPAGGVISDDDGNDATRKFRGAIVAVEGYSVMPTAG